MNTEKTEWVGYAEECVRLAALTNDAGIREQLMEMAHEWLAVAKAGSDARPMEQVGNLT